MLELQFNSLERSQSWASKATFPPPPPYSFPPFRGEQSSALRPSLPFTSYFSFLFPPVFPFSPAFAFDICVAFALYRSPSFLGELSFLFSYTRASRVGILCFWLQLRLLPVDMRSKNNSRSRSMLEFDSEFEALVKKLWSLNDAKKKPFGTVNNGSSSSP